MGAALAGLEIDRVQRGEAVAEPLVGHLDDPVVRRSAQLPQVRVLERFRDLARQLAGAERLRARIPLPPAALQQDHAQPRAEELARAHGAGRSAADDADVGVDRLAVGQRPGIDDHGFSLRACLWRQCWSPVRGSGLETRISTVPQVPGAGDARARGCPERGVARDAPARPRGPGSGPSHPTAAGGLGCRRAPTIAEPAASGQTAMPSRSPTPPARTARRCPARCSTSSTGST
jgi:hypothetical protein